MSFGDKRLDKAYDRWKTQSPNEDEEDTRPVKIKSKVVKFGKVRKIVEIPKAVRDSFDYGEDVSIVKDGH